MYWVFIPSITMKGMEMIKLKSKMLKFVALAIVAMLIVWLIPAGLVYGETATATVTIYKNIVNGGTPVSSPTFLFQWTQDDGVNWTEFSIDNPGPDPGYDLVVIPLEAGVETWIEEIDNPDDGFDFHNILFDPDGTQGTEDGNTAVFTPVPGDNGVITFQNENMNIITVHVFKFIENSSPGDEETFKFEWSQDGINWTEVITTHHLQPIYGRPYWMCEMTLPTLGETQIREQLVTPYELSRIELDGLDDPNAYVIDEVAYFMPEMGHNGVLDFYNIDAGQPIVTTVNIQKHVDNAPIPDSFDFLWSTDGINYETFTLDEIHPFEPFLEEELDLVPGQQYWIKEDLATQGCYEFNSIDWDDSLITVNLIEDGTVATFTAQEGSNGYIGFHNQDICVPPEKSIVVHVIEDQIAGFGWEEGDNITLTIDYGGVEPYTDMKPAGYSPELDEVVVDFFPGEQDGFDVMAGNIVTLSYGVSETFHVVKSQVITDIDVETDVIRGTADPGTVVEVWLEGPDPYNIISTADEYGI